MTDEFIDAEHLTLDEWLGLVFDPPKGKRFLRRAFPSDRHKEEYFSTIQNRSHEEVCRLLHSFLVHSSSIEFWDEYNFESLNDAYKHDRERYNRMISLTYYRRLVGYFRISKEIFPWEGNTWILDLLPHSPKIALEGLNAYIVAHIPLAPDMMLQGLFDSEEVIRAKYIGIPKTQHEKVALLLDLTSRQFENLAERLFHEKGYDTKLTQLTRDGGYDVSAEIDDGVIKEYLLIECKRMAEKVNIDIVRSFHSAIISNKANRGVLITSGKFTPDAKRWADDNHIQLIDGDNFVILLNEYFGANWGQHISKLCAESEKHYQENRVKFAQQKKRKNTAKQK